MTQARDVMTLNPVVLPPNTKIGDAAVLMRDREIGDVLVAEGDELIGIVTDRDIVIRALATGGDPSGATLSDICTPEPATIGPADDCTMALQLMAKRAVRRLPVVSSGQPVGILTLNDISATTDVGAVTAQIAAAPPTD